MLKNKNKSMDFIDKITLSPFEKYVRYNRFPWKFILHLSLLALCTYQALKIVSIQDKHTRIQEQIFSTIYLQNQQGSSSYPYYSLIDFTDVFFDLIDQTQTLNESLLQYSNIDDVKYRLEIYYTEVNEDNIDQMILEGDKDQYISKLEQIPLHEGNYLEMKNFIQQIKNMNIQIGNVLTYLTLNDSDQPNQCLNWTIQIQYSFQSFANIDSILNAQSFDCLNASYEEKSQESLIAVHFAVLIISIISLLLVWKRIYGISKEYMRHKNAIQKNPSEAEAGLISDNWQNLGFLQKVRFFDFWFVIITAGNLFQLFGALVAILDFFIQTDLVIFKQKQVLIGLGVMLAWITILKYLQHNSNLNLMTATLSKSWNNLLMFLLGVMPFFLGFAFLGQTIFWKYNKFQDTSSSVITLFSLLNGDIVNDTFLQTWAEGLIGQIYLIIFMILFYTAVQNVFVTIIMQGYEQSIKQEEQKKILEQKQKKQSYDFEKKLQLIVINNKEVYNSIELSSLQNQGMNKIKQNTRKIDLILQEMAVLAEEVQSSKLTKSQKNYLNQILKDNLQSIANNMSIQIHKK